jgi:hypothetical protein
MGGSPGPFWSRVVVVLDGPVMIVNGATAGFFGVEPQPASASTASVAAMARNKFALIRFASIGGRAHARLETLASILHRIDAEVTQALNYVVG